MSSDERRFSPATLPVGICLFFSGFCALIYQTVWLREFRLIFGSSTAASAAVLAVFMGGLGLGGVVLGRRVDQLGNSFRFYARLELAIALLAAVTPGLLWIASWAYVKVGGTLALGQSAGAGLRLLLTGGILLLPTFLMGGTLPAAVRAVQSEGDAGRRHVALLYSTNTSGAVLGTMLSTFFLLEHLGNRLTLCSACLVNLLVALTAWQVSHRFGSISSRLTQKVMTPMPEVSAIEGAGVGAPSRFVFGAAAVTGFAFFLMELIWYRMLGPLLGGSTFTFGLILAVALSGIAGGSLAYSLFGSGRPVTLSAFARVCALEAAFMALPYALGDRLAVWTILLQPLGGLGFPARVAAWSATACIVIFPPAVLAGTQFPMLISLLGKGRGQAGAHTALAYSWNTAGAIAGSLAGGFGLLPALGALGAWRMVVFVLLGLAAVAAALSWRRPRNFSQLLPTALTGALALTMLSATGPTAAWRHTPIGAGRVALKETRRTSVNGFTDFIQSRRRSLVWEAEGIESSVGLVKEDGLSFIVNGKSDGSARNDASTQVMIGLLGALVHAAPHDSLVIGLGTGSTAGWLAEVPTIERVDVLELEPAICTVAQYCAPVNRHALANPKLHLWFGDAREAMLTTRQRYDVIASEPSNPYRAGVASLFTREFYRAAAGRLRPGGRFVQWVQAYEVGGESIRTIYATLSSVFPVVETWKTHNGDLAFIASEEPIIYDLGLMRERVAQEPYRSALAAVWRVTDAEGVFGRYIGHRDLTDLIVGAHTPANTDDRNRLEFGFARTVGSDEGFDMDKLCQLALESHCDRPDVKNGRLDWEKVCDRRVSALVQEGQSNFESDSDEHEFRARTQAKAAYAKGNLRGALAAWRSQSQEPGDLMELLIVAQASVSQGDEHASQYLGQLAQWFPPEADALAAQLFWRQQQPAEAFAMADRALRGLRDNPWCRVSVMGSALDLAQLISKQNRGQPFALRLCETLREPFAIRLLDSERMIARLEMAGLQDQSRLAASSQEAIAEFEPHVPWTDEFLRLRVETYARSHDSRAVKALADLETFESREAQPFVLFTPEQVAATASKRGAPLGTLPVNARER